MSRHDTCESCKKNDARLRRCTSEFLCIDCRRDDRNRLVSRRRAMEILKSRDDNEDEDALREILLTCRSYRTANPTNPAFARITLYRECDVRDRARIIHENDKEETHLPVMVVRLV